MGISNKLEQLIDEYLAESDKRNIHCISIVIPGHKGHFFILDSFKLNLKKTEIFSLSIVFSFNHKSKRGQSLVEKNSATNCLDAFTILSKGRTTTYSKDFGLNKQNIVNNIQRIINELFSRVDINKIDIELKRITDWLTIQEQGSP